LFSFPDHSRGRQRREVADQQQHHADADKRYEHDTIRPTPVTYDRSNRNGLTTVAASNAPPMKQTTRLVRRWSKSSPQVRIAPRIPKQTPARVSTATCRRARIAPPSNDAACATASRSSSQAGCPGQHLQSNRQSQGGTPGRRIRTSHSAASAKTSACTRFERASSNGELAHDPPSCVRFA
jgi:hypothetical protein